MLLLEISLDNDIGKCVYSHSLIAIDLFWQMNKVDALFEKNVSSSDDWWGHVDDIIKFRCDSVPAAFGLFMRWVNKLLSKLCESNVIFESSDLFWGKKIFAKTTHVCSVSESEQKKTSTSSFAFFFRRRQTPMINCFSIKFHWNQCITTDERNERRHLRVMHYNLKWIIHIAKKKTYESTKLLKILLLLPPLVVLKLLALELNAIEMGDVVNDNGPPTSIGESAFGGIGLPPECWDVLKSYRIEFCFRRFRRRRNNCFLPKSWRCWASTTWARFRHRLVVHHLCCGRLRSLQIGISPWTLWWYAWTKMLIVIVADNVWRWFTTLFSLICHVRRILTTFSFPLLIFETFSLSPFCSTILKPDLSDQEHTTRKKTNCINCK